LVFIGKERVFYRGIEGRGVWIIQEKEHRPSNEKRKLEVLFKRREKKVR